MKINQFITMGAQEAQTNQAYSVHHTVQPKGSIFFLMGSYLSNKNQLDSFCPPLKSAVDARGGEIQGHT